MYMYVPPLSLVSRAQQLCNPISKHYLTAPLYLYMYEEHLTLADTPHFTLPGHVMDTNLVKNLRKYTYEYNMNVHRPSICGRVIFKPDHTHWTYFPTYKYIFTLPLNIDNGFHILNKCRGLDKDFS